jgi:hypothetical protein
MRGGSEGVPLSWLPIASTNIQRETYAGVLVSTDVVPTGVR